MSQTLFVIEHALGDLFETRQEIIDQVAFTDEQIADKQAALDAVDAAIVETVTAEVRKVDGVSRKLIEWDAQIDAIEKEVERLEAIAARIKQNRKRLADLVLQIMRDTDTKKLEGKLGTLRRQNNGGVLSVEVVQPDLVPERLQTITVRANAAFWSEIVRRIGNMEDAFSGNVKVSAPEPDLTAIRAELDKRVSCPSCAVLARMYEAMLDQKPPCETCGDTGTVSNGVPGCRLKPRGERLVVG